MPHAYSWTYNIPVCYLLSVGDPGQPGLPGRPGGSGEVRCKFRIVCFTCPQVYRSIIPIGHKSATRQ